MLSLFWCLFAGVLYATGFPLWGSDFSFFLGPCLGLLILVAQLLKTTQLSRQLLKGFLFQEGLYFAGYYWIPHTLQEFGGMPLPVAHLGGFLFGLIVLPHVTVFIFLQHHMRKHLTQYEKNDGRIFPDSIKASVLCLVYVLLEYFLPQQFPAHVGHSWMYLAPYLPLTPYFGSFFYSLISVFLSFNMALAWRNRKLGAGVPALVPLLVVLSLGLLFPLKKIPSTATDYTIRMVQPNIGNNMKLSAERGVPNSVYAVIDKYRELSLQPSDKKLDLIIWPETAFPSLLSTLEMKHDQSAIPQVVREVLAMTQAPLIMGGYDENKGEMQGFMSEYNTAFLFMPDKQLEYYHKLMLIPFGEGLPFGPLNPYLAKIITNISFFARGKEPVQFQLTPMKITPIICYEVLFPELVRSFLNSSKTPGQVLVNLTNDSWYGDTSEPHQHLFLAKWRALEFQIPIVRSTNTGISSVIFPDGSESQRLNPGEVNFIDTTVPITQGQVTFFLRWGIWPGLLFWLLIILPIVYWFEKLTITFQSPHAKDHVIG